MRWQDLCQPLSAYEPELSLLRRMPGHLAVLPWAHSIKGFLARYEAEWRPDLCARFQIHRATQASGRAFNGHRCYINRNIFTLNLTKPISHLHIDLLERAQDAVMAGACWNRSWKTSPARFAGRASLPEPHSIRLPLDSTSISGSKN